MTEQKEKGYQGIRATEAFEYENIRSDFKHCITEKNEQLQGHQGPKGHFQIKLPLTLIVLLMN